MKRIICIFLIILFSNHSYSVEDKLSLEFTILGTSYHTNKSREYNSSNDGIGVNIIWERVSKVDFLLSFGTYKDSNYGLYLDDYKGGKEKMFDKAQYAMVGIRKVFGDRESWHCNIGASAGYYKGSGFKGIGGLPYIGIGYDRVTLYATGYPKYKSDTALVALFLNIKIIEF